MKPSSLLVVVVTTALITLCTSFSSGKGASLSTLSPTALKDNTHYYWYLADGGAYDGFWTVAQELTRMEDDYGVFCDTDPTGGTTVARGYAIPYPNLIWPSQFVFAHF